MDAGFGFHAGVRKAGGDRRSALSGRRNNGQHSVEVHPRKRIQKECRHSDPAVRLQEEKGACRTRHEDVSETISQGGAADGKATYYV